MICRAQGWSVLSVSSERCGSPWASPATEAAGLQVGRCGLETLPQKHRTTSATCPEPIHPHLAFLASDSVTQQTFPLSLLVRTRQESQLAVDETPIALHSPSQYRSGAGGS